MVPSAVTTKTRFVQVLLGACRARACLFKPKGSDSHGCERFSDRLPVGYHPDQYKNLWLQEQSQDYCGPNTGRNWASLRGGHGDDVEDQDSPSEHCQPTVEDAPDVEAYLNRVEQGKSSQAVVNRKQSTDDGLSRFRTRHANSRAEDEEAETRVKKYLETSRQGNRAQEETEGIERILCEERADFERRYAQRGTTETRPQPEVAQAQPHGDRKGKEKEPATTNETAHLQEEADIQHKAAEHRKETAQPQPGNGERRKLNEHRVGQVQDVYERIVCHSQEVVQWREAERARIEARLRAAQQAADEEYMALLHHDLLVDEATMHDGYLNPEDMMPRLWPCVAPIHSGAVFFPGPPPLPEALAADDWAYGVQDAHRRLDHGRWVGPQAGAGQLDGPRAGLPYPRRPSPRPIFWNDNRDGNWDKISERLDRSPRVDRLKNEDPCAVQ
jgi:hypothetical protein